GRQARLLPGDGAGGAALQEPARAHRPRRQGRRGARAHHQQRRGRQRPLLRRRHARRARGDAPRRGLRRHRHRGRDLAGAHTRRRQDLQGHASPSAQGGRAQGEEGRGAAARRRRRRPPRCRRRVAGRAAGDLRDHAGRPAPHRPRMTRKRKPPRPRAKGLERTKYALLAALAGALWFTSCADFDIWPFAWVAMVPCIYAIEHASTMRRAVFYGWITGLVANAGGFYWITKLLTRFAHLPLALALFAYLLMSAYQGGVFALFAWAYRRIR